MKDLNETIADNARAAEKARASGAGTGAASALTFRCSKHPHYDGARPPRNSCFVCARVWQLRWKKTEE